MTLSLQEMSDRFEIQDLLYFYSNIIDSKQFDKLRDVFTKDALIDYSAFGGPVGNLEDTITFLKKALAIFPNTQHLNANLQIVITGDTATGRIMCLNPQVIKTSEEETTTFMLGLWYVDEYVRTDDGWRMSSRGEEKSWTFAVPDFMEI